MVREIQGEKNKWRRNIQTGRERWKEERLKEERESLSGLVFALGCFTNAQKRKRKKI